MRYYKRLGFEEVRFIEEKLTDFMDRISWGGEGTIMKVELDKWTRKWAPLFRNPGSGLL